MGRGRPSETEILIETLYRWQGAKCGMLNGECGKSVSRRVVGRRRPWCALGAQSWDGEGIVANRQSGGPGSVLCDGTVHGFVLSVSIHHNNVAGAQWIGGGTVSAG